MEPRVDGRYRLERPIALTAAGEEFAGAAAAGRLVAVGIRTAPRRSWPRLAVGTNSGLPRR